jgi:hypothetical protein
VQTHASRRGMTLPLLALLSMAAGCASAGTGATSSDPSIIAVTTGDGSTWELRRGSDVRLNQAVTLSAQEAWAALPAVYQQLGLTPDVRDPSTRQLGVSDHRFSRQVLNRRASDFFDCGTDPGLNRPTADQVPVNARITTQVLEQGGNTELRTTVQGTARRTGGNAGVANCQSTGLFEILIGRMVQGRESGT